MYTLETYDECHSVRHWRELSVLYPTIEQAIEAAGKLWEDEDHLYSRIRVKRTETVCTLIAPEAEEA